MRTNSVNLHVRLNLNKPDQKRAWDYLEKVRMDPNVRMNQLLAEAIIEKAEKDRGYETSVSADDCAVVQESIQLVTAAIETEIASAIPACIARVSLAAAWNVLRQANFADSVEPSLNSNEDGLNGRPIPPEEIDWSYLGE